MNLESPHSPLLLSPVSAVQPLRAREVLLLLCSSPLECTLLQAALANSHPKHSASSTRMDVSYTSLPICMSKCLSPSQSLLWNPLRKLITACPSAFFSLLTILLETQKARPIFSIFFSYALVELGCIIGTQPIFPGQEMNLTYPMSIAMDNAYLLWHISLTSS